MRDPDRIEAIVVALRTLWVKYPDMRFGQMIKFITPGRDLDRDAFYIEDDEWLAHLLTILRELEDEPAF